MSFAKYSDISFNNMESMVSSSIQKYRVQTSSSKEPNLLYKLMVSKVIGKLKEMLFDPDFVNCNEQRKSSANQSGQTEMCGPHSHRVADKPVPTSEKSRVNTQLQNLLKKRIAAKNKRSTNCGENKAKARKLSGKEEIRFFGSADFKRSNSFTLLIPVHCISNP